MPEQSSDQITDRVTLLETAVWKGMVHDGQRLNLETQARLIEEIERLRAEIIELRADQLGYQNALRAVLGDPANTITAEHHRAG
jgi:hypothetical protein